MGSHSRPTWSPTDGVSIQGRQGSSDSAQRQQSSLCAGDASRNLTSPRRKGQTRSLQRPCATLRQPTCGTVSTNEAYTLERRITSPGDRPPLEPLAGAEGSHGRRPVGRLEADAEPGRSAQPPVQEAIEDGAHGGATSPFPNLGASAAASRSSLPSARVAAGIGII